MNIEEFDALIDDYQDAQIDGGFSDRSKARGALKGAFRALEAERDALREQVDALLQHCPEGECYTCSKIICPHGDAMHFHHDGCPACAEHDAAIAEKEPK